MRDDTKIKIRRTKSVVELVQKMNLATSGE